MDKTTEISNAIMNHERNFIPIVNSLLMICQVLCFFILKPGIAIKKPSIQKGSAKISNLDGSFSGNNFCKNLKIVTHICQKKPVCGSRSSCVVPIFAFYNFPKFLRFCFSGSDFYHGSHYRAHHIPEKPVG